MMNRPGPRNTICDVPGIRVGQAEDRTLLTGVSVIVPDMACVAAVDHRGGGVGARDTVLLGPGATVPSIHAIVLAGGSAYGLDAAGGAMQWLREQGRGFAVAGEIVPIVPAAIIFDLATGGPKTWDGPVWWHLGREAAAAACSTWASAAYARRCKMCV